MQKYAEPNEKHRKTKPEPYKTPKTIQYIKKRKKQNQHNIRNTVKEYRKQNKTIENNREPYKRTSKTIQNDTKL